MSRPPLPIGTWGEIHTRQVRRGCYRARARFRDTDGQTRLVSVTAETRSGAVQALRHALTERAKPSPREAQIRPDMRLSRLAEIWLAHLEDEGRIELSTINEYRRTLHNTVLPKLGGLLLREVTTGYLDQFLIDVWKSSPNRQRKSKVVLAGMLDMAVRHDALTHNPIRATTPLRRPRTTARVMTTEDLQTVRAAVQAWMAKPRPGPKTSQDMADIVDLMLATGCRIGEILALRWTDLNIDATPPTVTVTGTIKTDPGRGTYRKPTPKTDHSNRTLVLPQFAVEMLRRRRATTPPNPVDAVFATRTGTWHQLSNIERRWRQIRAGTGLEWVTPHTFRKTVATVVAGESSTENAANQLGHSSATITREFYIAKPAITADVSDILQTLAPESLASYGLADQDEDRGQDTA